MNGVIQAVALAIYTEFVRERDQSRALQRFNRLPDHTREQFEAEAKAAIRTCEVHFNAA